MYKLLFSSHVSDYVKLDEDVKGDIPQLSIEENAILTAPFIDKKLWDAISQIEDIKATRLVGFQQVLSAVQACHKRRLYVYFC